MIAGDAAKLDKAMRVLGISREQLAEDITASVSQKASANPVERS